MGNDVGQIFRELANIGITRCCMRWYMRKKNPSFAITVCHHSASLVVPIGYPQYGFLYSILTLMMDSYNLSNGIYKSDITDKFYVQTIMKQSLSETNLILLRNDILMCDSHKAIV